MIIYIMVYMFITNKTCGKRQLFIIIRILTVKYELLNGFCFEISEIINDPSICGRTKCQGKQKVFDTQTTPPFTMCSLRLS